MSDVTIQRSDSSPLIQRVESQPIVERTGGGVAGPKGDPGPPGLSFQTRAAMAAFAATDRDDAFLTEPRREGTFIFDGSNLSAAVAADPQGAVYLAPSSNATGASGAWVRQRDGEYVLPEWFGAVGDGVTNDLPAFEAMRAFCTATGKNAGSGLKSGPTIILSNKTYYLASSFDWKGCTNSWQGTGPGFAHMSEGTGTAIKMAEGATFFVQRGDTEGTGLGTTIPFGGDGTQFFNVTFRGPGKGAGTTPVVWWRARAVAHECRFIEGKGPGLKITGTAGATHPAGEGNTNSWRLYGGYCSSNGTHGLVVGDPAIDATGNCNAGLAVGTSFDNNSGKGVLDESFLGNAFLGCHWDNNVQGHVEQTNPNAVSKFEGYFETGYQTARLQGRSRISGLGGGYDTVGAQTGADEGLISHRPGMLVSDSNNIGDWITLQSAGNLVDRTIHDWRTNTFNGGAAGYVARFSGGNITFGFGYVAADRLKAVNGSSGPRFSLGRSTPLSGLHVYREIGIGDGTFDFDQGRIVRYGTAAPTSGNHAAGEIIFNSAPSAGGKLGWVCVTSGNPGSWKPFGAIDA